CPNGGSCRIPVAGTASVPWTPASPLLLRPTATLRRPPDSSPRCCRSSRTAGVKPQCRVTSRQNILLQPEGGHEKAVDYVLRGHDQLHVPVHRHMQLVDLPLPVRVLQLPHPLLGHHVDFH